MFMYTLSEISKAIGAVQCGSDGECIIENIVIDSRAVGTNSLFFALAGEVTDGHRFVKSALNSGAIAAVVEAYVDGIPKEKQLLVDDTMAALQALSAYHRNKFNIPFVAVTGSSGKTTTKDVIASVLSQKYHVRKTDGNLNSTTGVLLTLFELEEQDDIAVIEISMSHPGEILANARIVRPNTAVITNIGVAHIEYLKTRENIFKAKSEILTFLGSDDVAIVNYDDDYLSTISSDIFKVIPVGISGGELKACDISFVGGEAKFTVVINKQKEEFSFAVANHAGVTDAMLAIAVGLRYNVEPDKIRKGLIECVFSDNRMEKIKINGITLINDTYNANPDSMKAACDMLSNTDALRRIAVLCDMYELGEAADKMHFSCGEYAAAAGIDILLTSGEYSESFADGYNSRKACDDAIVFADKKSIVAWLKKNIRKDDAILFKASRGMMLEEVYDEIRKELSK